MFDTFQDSSYLRGHPMRFTFLILSNQHNGILKTSFSTSQVLTVFLLDSNVALLIKTYFHDCYIFKYAVVLQLVLQQAKFYCAHSRWAQKRKHKPAHFELASFHTERLQFFPSTSSSPITWNNSNHQCATRFINSNHHWILCISGHTNNETTNSRK